MSNMKPGDWMCAACGDHVFARNTECRKCGTPKGGAGGGGMGGGMNPMAAMMAMMGMGGGGGGGMGSNRKPGDWSCPGCGDHQFARNTECRKCGTANPGGGGGMMGGGGGGGGKGQKPGDWFCPNCNDLQFAKNAECRKCSTPNPDLAGSLAAKDAGLAAGQLALGENLKPGDWYCPSCNDLNFAKNAVCRKCKTPNPDAAASIEAASASGNFRPAGKGGNNQEKKPGDWNCTACGDLQFARNSECRKCGTPNMSGGKGGGGMGAGNQAANPAMMMQMMQMMGTMMGQMTQNQNGGNQMGGNSMMGGMQQQQPQQQMGDPNCKWCAQGQCWTHGQGKGGHGRAAPY